VLVSCAICLDLSSQVYRCKHEKTTSKRTLYRVGSQRETFGTESQIGNFWATPQKGKGVSLFLSFASSVCRVSQSHTGQVMSVLQLSPSLQGERESSLINRQGLQERQLPHQLCFCDALPLAVQWSLRFLRADTSRSWYQDQSEWPHHIRQSASRDSIESDLRQNSRWSERCGTIDLGQDSCRPSQEKATPLPMEAR
jgi:hypothetical protein